MDTRFGCAEGLVEARSGFASSKDGLDFGLSKEWAEVVGDGVLDAGVGGAFNIAGVEDVPEGDVVV